MKDFNDFVPNLPNPDLRVLHEYEKHRQRIRNIINSHLNQQVLQAAPPQRQEVPPKHQWMPANQQPPAFHTRANNNPAPARQNQQQQARNYRQQNRVYHNEPIYIESSSDDEEEQNVDRGLFAFANFIPDFLLPRFQAFRQFENPIRMMQTPEPPKPAPPLPKRTCSALGMEFTIPIIPEQAVKLIENALKLAPEMDFAKASAFLNLVIQTNKYPDDIVDRLVLSANDPRQGISAQFQSESLNVLFNYFNNVSQTSLRSAFTQNKKRIFNTIEQLTSHPLQVMRSLRAKKGSMVITDCFVAYDIMLFEKRELEKKAKEDAEAKELQEIEEARANGSLIECSCCFCEVPFDRCLQCPEGHVFCKNCVMKMIETTISEGRSSVKCPAMDGCGLDIPMSQLERAIPEKTLQRLFQTEAMNDVIKSGLPNLVKCANCGFIVEFLGSSNMRCPQCQKETCSKCGLLAHPGKTCEEAKAVDPDKIVEEKMNDAIIRVCPKCHTPFMKDEGCNKMVCPRCQTWICYWCRQVIPKNVGYDHFWREAGPCPPDRCPLWVENKQLHIIEAAKAKMDASEKATNEGN